MPTNVYASSGDMWGLGMVLLGLVSGGRGMLSTSCGRAAGGAAAASLDDLQEHIAGQLTSQLHQARASCMLQYLIPAECRRGG